MNHSSDRNTPTTPVEATILALDTPAHVQLLKEAVDTSDKAFFASHPGETRYVRHQCHGEWWPYVMAYSGKTLVMLLPDGTIGKAPLATEIVPLLRVLADASIEEAIAEAIGYYGVGADGIVDLDRYEEYTRLWYDKHCNRAEGLEKAAINAAQWRWREAEKAHKLLNGLCEPISLYYTPEAR